MWNAGSDFDRIATGSPALKYAIEVIGASAHANGDHWFVNQILSLSKSIRDREQATEISYLIEELNSMAEGKTPCQDIAFVRKVVANRLQKAGVDSEESELMRIDIADFPPGFFQSIASAAG